MDSKSEKHEPVKGPEDPRLHALEEAYDLLDKQKRGNFAKFSAAYTLGQSYESVEQINERLHAIRSSLKIDENEITDKLTQEQIQGNKTRVEDLRAQETALILNRLA